MNAAKASAGSNAIDEIIAVLGDWRGDALAQVRELIVAAVPDAVDATMLSRPRTRSESRCGVTVG